MHFYTILEDLRSRTLRRKVLHKEGQTTVLSLSAAKRGDACLLAQTICKSLIQYKTYSQRC